MPARKDLIGQQFGRLTVLSLGRYEHRRRYWVCRCSCGTEKEVSAPALLHAGVQSCGCLQREVAQGNATHGMSKTPTYKSWMMMRIRCTNPSYDAYSYYGGRGIKVCDRWLDSFENFLEDMGVRPSGMTLDRIDSDGNYEPSNCRWATRKEQVENRLNNVILDVNGAETKLLDLAKELGVSRKKLYGTLYRNGMLPEVKTSVKGSLGNTMV